MKHVPHLVLPPPWSGSALELPERKARHLTKVLRMQTGEKVSYTDGLGMVGSGVLSGESIERGEEGSVSRPTDLTVAVAPPAKKDRQRFLVEKLAELGVARLLWLETRHGETRIASGSKQLSWVEGAVEQSRGGYLMETSDDLVELPDLEGRVAVCRQAGSPEPGEVDVVAIGPEGGFADSELPEDTRLWSLGPTVLRVETAAVVAVARLTGF